MSTATATEITPLPLPATVPSVPMAFVEKTNTRGKFRAWASQYNIKVLRFRANGTAIVRASSAAAEILRANGFWIFPQASGCFFVRRDRNVAVSETIYLVEEHAPKAPEKQPGLYSKKSKIRRVFYRCKNKTCKRVTVEETEGKISAKNCPHCGWGTKASFLESFYSTHKKHVCNSSCVYAKGAVCTCGCGGKNHGVGHMG